MNPRVPPPAAGRSSSRRSMTDSYPTMQQFAAEILAGQGQGEVSPVSPAQFAAVLRAGNVAHGRQGLARRRGRRNPIPEQAVQVTSASPSPGDLPSERPGLPRDRTRAGRAEEAGRDGGRSEVDGDDGGRLAADAAKELTIQRLRTGVLRRRQKMPGLVPSRGSPERTMERRIDEVERQWGCGASFATRVLMENRRNTSMLGEKTPWCLEHSHCYTSVGGLAAMEEGGEEEEEVFLSDEAGEQTSTVLFIPGEVGLPIPTLSDIVLATATVSEPEEGTMLDGSASSLSLVTTVFDVRVPTPPPRTTAGVVVVVVDDRRHVLPSAQWHARQAVSRGAMGSGNNSNDTNSRPTGLRRSRDRPVRSRPGPIVRHARPPGRLEVASAPAACEEDVVRTSVPAALVPGEKVPRPSSPDHPEAGVAEGYDQWSSAEEMGLWYGRLGNAYAPGDDEWRSRWMEYDGDFR